ncbi:MAG: 16S rRNA (uracil(1498)-N(3))-methyltransferase [Oleiphilaceae bacterium]|nr:16S rRNA (uracil(1498)-N(3))-methyltransferase [Oleiphilaceae bacterium]
MRIPNIYVSTNLDDNASITLDDQAAQHIIKVLRMKKGFALQLFNGDGYYYPATIATIDRRNVTVQTKDRIFCESESNLHTHLAIVMSRGDRMDYAIQKACELGVNQITPLTSERCEVRLDNQQEDKRIKRWQQIAVSACEQCGRATVPSILQVESLDNFVNANATNKVIKLVLHHRDTQDLATVSPSPERVIILIGPEGGLTSDEINHATQNNFMACTLGPRVLRTETAPVTILSVLQWLWGDFN